MHDIGEHDDQPFLVMEYLEGETLKDRIHSAAGSRPLEMQTLLMIVVLYFVLGFFFYSSMYAAVRAMVSSEQDTQQDQRRADATRQDEDEAASELHGVIAGGTQLDIRQHQQVVGEEHQQRRELTLFPS